MPDVTLRRDPAYINDENVQKLAKGLQHIISKALTVPGTKGELTKNDIVVRVFDHSPFDIGTRGLELTIVTEDMPERKENLQERTEMIVSTVSQFSGLKDCTIQKDKNNVWVILVSSEFKEF